MKACEVRRRGFIKAPRGKLGDRHLRERRHDADGAGQRGERGEESQGMSEQRSVDLKSLSVRDQLDGRTEAHVNC